MLSVNKYPIAYINECRGKIENQITAYEKFAAAIRIDADSGDAILKDKLKQFERQFFGHMLLAMDHYFCHHTRTLEKKDGNPLNEIRMLCNSIMEGDGTLRPDSTIKYKADTAVLKLTIGDEITLNAEAFRKITHAFFGELTEKFS